MIVRLKDTTVKAVVAKIRQHPYLHTPDICVIDGSVNQKTQDDLKNVIKRYLSHIVTDDSETGQEPESYQYIQVGDYPTGTIQGELTGPFFSPDVLQALELEEEQCTWDFESHVENYFAWRTRGGYLLSLYESDDEEAPYDVFLYIEHEDKEAHESTMFVPNVLSAIFKDI